VELEKRHGVSNICYSPYLSFVDWNIEALPSMTPQKKYCDITGLEVTTTQELQTHQKEDWA
jgi:hypothetical protein